MLADYVPAFNVVNFAISVVVIAVVAFVGRLAGYAQVFISQMPKYAHIPRHPKWIALADLYDQKGGFETKFMAGMRNDDQTFKPVVNLGPWGNGHTYLAVQDAAAFRTILPDLTNFPKNPATYNWFSYLIGKGLIVASGENWRVQRKRITPLFHMAILKRCVPVMVDITKELLKFLKKQSSDYHPAKQLFALHAMRIIVNLAFGGDFDPHWMLAAWERVEHAFNDWTWGWCVFGDIWNHIPIPAAAGFSKARMVIRNKLSEVIDARRAKLDQMAEEGIAMDEADQSNLLYVLLQSTNGDGEDWTNEEIIDQAITFLFAGHDTSSVALSWSLYYMAKQPECFAKLREEADRVLGDRDPTHEDLAELSYTHHFVKEVLRIRPPVPLVDRIAAEDCEVAGHKIPAGTYLSMFIWNIARDARYYKNPDEFNPDRWQENIPDVFTNVPFSAGARICIGSKFSIQEIIIALSMIARELDVAYDHTQNVVPAFEGVMVPRNLKLKFRERVRV